MKKYSEILKKCTLFSGIEEEKFLTFLSYQAKKCGKNKFLIPFDRQELADYLQVDRSGLSNEISKLKREKVINCVKNSFEII